MSVNSVKSLDLAPNCYFLESCRANEKDFEELKKVKWYKKYYFIDEEAITLQKHEKESELEFLMEEPCWYSRNLLGGIYLPVGGDNLIEIYSSEVRKKVLITRNLFYVDYLQPFPSFQKQLEKMIEEKNLGVKSDQQLNFRQEFEQCKIDCKRIFKNFYLTTKESPTSFSYRIKHNETRNVKLNMGKKHFLKDNRLFDLSASMITFLSSDLHYSTYFIFKIMGFDLLRESERWNNWDKEKRRIWTEHEEIERMAKEMEEEDRYKQRQRELILQSSNYIKFHEENLKLIKKREELYHLGKLNPGNDEIAIQFDDIERQLKTRRFTAELVWGKEFMRDYKFDCTMGYLREAEERELRKKFEKGEVTLESQAKVEGQN